MHAVFFLNVITIIYKINMIGVWGGVGGGGGYLLLVHLGPDNYVNNDNNVHLSHARQRPEHSHHTY